MKLSLVFPLFYAAAAGIGVAAKKKAQCLYNSDFSDGTYIIDQPGSYKWVESSIGAMLYDVMYV